MSAIANASATVVVATNNATISAAAAVVENLDERMERIRKRNEELEQKHREAEADRLAALRNNAMVVTTRPVAAAAATDADDWPRAHRYDSYDFPYETAALDGKSAANSNTSSAEHTGESNAETPASAQPASSAKGPGGRDYKKFADGEGPPPDPSFNFLADAERDGKRRTNAGEKMANGGKVAQQLNGGERSNKDWRSPANNAADGDATSSAHRQRGGVQGGSFKGTRGPNNINNNGAGNKGNNVAGRLRNAQQPKRDDSAVNVEWRHERERIDEARIGRQKTGDGKWRREWDNEKAEGKGDGNQQSKAPPANNNVAVEKDGHGKGGKCK